MVNFSSIPMELLIEMPVLFLCMEIRFNLKVIKKLGKDFTIKTQSKQAKGYTIIFSDPNQFLIKNILCIFLLMVKNRNYTLIAKEKHILIFQIAIPSMYSILYFQYTLPVKDKKMKITGLYLP
jgi:hypothetical protein